MFGVDTSELIIVAVLALIFIGPNELPKVMLKLGRFAGKVRGYARHFTDGIESAMREAELQEMEKEWRAQNQRILAQHPADAHYDEPTLPAMTDLPPEGVPGEYAVDPHAPGLEEPGLPFAAPAAPDADPRPPHERELP